MAAQPRITQQPRYTPQYANDDPYGGYPNPSRYGARSKMTIPMSHDLSPEDFDIDVDENVEIRIRGKCRSCKGRGVVAGAVVECPTCHSIWWRATVEKHQSRFGWLHAWVELPCQHRINKPFGGSLPYTEPECGGCHGAGVRYYWIRWGHYLNLVHGYVGGDDQDTTAILTALARTTYGTKEPTPLHTPLHTVADYARSGTPTAPPVSPNYHSPHNLGPVAPNYQPPSQQHPQQVPVTPRFVTPLQPNDNNSF